MATITGLTAARMLAIEAASVVDGDIVGDDLILTKYDASTINAGNVRGSRANRNRIINGDFAVNQRGFTSLSSSSFGFDRWNYDGIGGTTTYSAQTAALGDLSESARTFARLLSSGQSAAADLARFEQRIESVRTLSGKTATISFWAKATSGTPKLAIEFSQFFGATGSPSADVNTYAGQVTLSTTWTRYSVTIAIPSVAGKTLGSAGNDGLYLRLWTSAGSNFNARTGSLGLQSATIDFWGVQVEEGSTLTPFEQEDYATNLRRCQRYYQKSWPYEQAPGTDNTAFPAIVQNAARIIDVHQTDTWGGAPVLLPIEMRTIPTILIYSVAGLQTNVMPAEVCVYSTGTFATTMGNTIAARPTYFVPSIQNSAAAGVVGGIRFQWTASAEL